MTRTDSSSTTRQTGARPDRTREELLKEPTLTFEEGVYLSKVAKSTFEKLCRSGAGPNSFYIGRRRYFNTPEFVQWLNAQKSHAQPTTVTRKSGV